MPEMSTLNGYELVDAKAREDITKVDKNAMKNPIGASIGQIIEVASVDSDGVPAAYKAVDKPKDISDAVRYSTQNLTESQQSRARQNIGAAAATDIPTKVSQLTNDSKFVDEDRIKNVENQLVTFQQIVSDHSRSIDTHSKAITEVSKDITYIKDNMSVKVNVSYDEATGNLEISGSMVSYDEATGDLSI